MIASLLMSAVQNSKEGSRNMKSACTAFGSLLEGYGERPVERYVSDERESAKTRNSASLFGPRTVRTLPEMMLTMPSPRIPVTPVPARVKWPALTLFAM